MKKVIFLLCILLFLPSYIFASYIPEVDRRVPRDSKVNVQVYIPSLLIGILSGNMSFKVTDRFSIGPEGSYFAYGKYRGYSLEAAMNYALSGDVFGGRVWLLNPHIGYTCNNIFYIDKYGSNYTKKVGAIVSGLNLVYQWAWDSGVNMRLGVGITYSSNKPLLHIGDSHFGGVALFSLGYAF